MGNLKAKLSFIIDRIRPVLQEKGEIHYLDAALVLNMDPTNVTKYLKLISKMFPQYYEYKRGVLRVKKEGEEQ